MAQNHCTSTQRETKLPVGLDVWLPIIFPLAVLKVQSDRGHGLEKEQHAADLEVLGCPPGGPEGCHVQTNEMVALPIQLPMQPCAE